MLNEVRVGVPVQEELEIQNAHVVDGAVNEEGVVFYQVAVSSGYHSWTVQKRYSQFEELHSSLRFSADVASLPALPPKKNKLLSRHTAPPFIEERRALLDNYLKKLIALPTVGKSQQVVNFLSVDKVSTSGAGAGAAAAAGGSSAGGASGPLGAHASPGARGGASLASSHDFQEQEDDLPESQEITDVSIPSTRLMSDHVLYQIDCSNSRVRRSFGNWVVLKRFGQFYDMDVALRESLEATVPHVLETMPKAPGRKAKLWHDHEDPDFIEERRVLLENYLKKLLRIPQVASNPHFVDFLGVK